MKVSSMKVCEQLTKHYKGCLITADSLLYEIIEFNHDGDVLVYDKLLDQFVIKNLKVLATFELVED